MFVPRCVRIQTTVSVWVLVCPQSVTFYLSDWTMSFETLSVCVSRLVKLCQNVNSRTRTSYCSVSNVVHLFRLSVPHPLSVRLFIPLSLCVFLTKIVLCQGVVVSEIFFYSHWSNVSLFRLFQFPCTCNDIKLMICDVTLLFDNTKFLNQLITMILWLHTMNM